MPPTSLDTLRRELEDERRATLSFNRALDHIGRRLARDRHQPLLAIGADA
jgi:hypothetical protein